MEWSVYNSIIIEKNIKLLYNSLTNTLLEITNDLDKKISKYILDSNINIFDDNTIDFFTQNKIIVKSNKDEFYKLKFISNGSRFDLSSLSLTLVVTHDCNFKCKYCFESNKRNIYMDETAQNEVIDFIIKKDKKNIGITWMGGEPLLNLNAIINITKKVKEIKPENYSSGIVTNGYLLNKENIHILKELSIDFIQITIDGLEVTHNNRKPTINNYGTFRQIEKNLHLLKELYDGSVIIRVNIDKTNQEEFYKVCKYFKDLLEAPNFNISPGFIQQNENCIFQNAECIYDYHDKVNFYLTQSLKFKNNYVRYYPKFNCMECGIRNINSFVIGPECEIYKCWNDIGQIDKVVGNIKENKISNNDLLVRYLSAGDPFENPECKTCNVLPICLGGCVYNRIESEYKNIPFNDCSIFKNHLPEFLTYHARFKNETKL